MKGGFMDLIGTARSNLRWALFIAVLATVIAPTIVLATPPEYTTFGRDQETSPTIDEQDLLRIWVVYIDQGDGILIQLPSQCNYDPNPDDSDNSRSERVDILIDGGSSPVSEAWRISDFIEVLYDSQSPIIEHAVISHHDQDHVAGLTSLLDDTSIGIETIYHNGLASYKGGVRGFPTNRKPDEPAVYQFRGGRLRRGMAFLRQNDSQERMKVEYLINSLGRLQIRFRDGEFQGVYDGLASAVVNKTDPSVQAFIQLKEGGGFIATREQELDRGVNLSGITFEVLWPLDPCRKYGDWGETINGNSVTFKLTYGQFEMLFTGDHNDKSEEAFLKHLEAQNRTEVLQCDVLKVPHHGSSHAHEAFFETANPVISVASMGDKGFKSKRVYGSGGWQHPSTDVIRWLGGHHRVYCTVIHEKRFRWEALDTKAKHEAMKEYSHILIETDGTWFRIVELPDADPGLIGSPPTVQQTSRGDGTRWISAN